MRPRANAETVRIREHIESLKGAPWLGDTRRWWPGFLFHSTDIRNIVNILKSGELLSRVQAETAKSLQVDIAAPEIIAHTPTESQDYVRLYFRPQTPTQYHNEGFRPVGHWGLGAHCPLPVYLLLDAFAVLSRQDSLFTDGNVASGAQTRQSAEDLDNIPFDLIYHVGTIPSEDIRTVVYHRNAEVLVHQRLGIDAVRYLVCRSQAEYETLLYLLPPGVHSRWVDQIRVGPILFFRQWTFVEQVEMTNRRVIFKFNRDSKTPGPFDAQVEIVEALGVGSQPILRRFPRFRANNTLDLDLSDLQDPSDYSVRLTLDDQLAFANRYQEDHLPF